MSLVRAQPGHGRRKVHGLGALMKLEAQYGRIGTMKKLGKILLKKISVVSIQRDIEPKKYLIPDQFGKLTHLGICESGLIIYEKNTALNPLVVNFSH